MKTVKILSVSLALLLMTGLIGGCSGGLSSVKGNVTLDGKPVEGLEVLFVPKDPSKGTEAIAYTDAEGNYELAYPGDKIGAPAGEYTVKISGSEGDGTEKPIRVAKKWNSASEETRTVESGSNVFDFEVTSK